MTSRPTDWRESTGTRVDSESSQTDWSMIFRAAHGAPDPAREAWEQLGRRYWPAIYAYIRRSGRDVHEAADLTQGFICDVLIGRKLLSHADPARGRFRSLLVTSLRNYLIDGRRRTSAHKAGGRRSTPPPGLKGGSSDSASSPSPQSPVPHTLRESDLVTGESPEAAFDAQWSNLLVRRVLERVRGQCETDGLRRHWSVFELRVARPMLTGGLPQEYSVLVDRFNIRDAAQAANMMVTVKRRFARALYEEVGATVSDPAQIDEELHALLHALERQS